MKKIREQKHTHTHKIREQKIKFLLLIIDSRLFVLFCLFVYFFFDFKSIDKLATKRDSLPISLKTFF